MEQTAYLGFTIGFDADSCVGNTIFRIRLQRQISIWLTSEVYLWFDLWLWHLHFYSYNSVLEVTLCHSKVVFFFRAERSVWPHHVLTGFWRWPNHWGDWDLSLHKEQCLNVLKLYYYNTPSHLSHPVSATQSDLIQKTYNTVVCFAPWKEKKEKFNFLKNSELIKTCFLCSHLCFSYIWKHWQQLIKLPPKWQTEWQTTTTNLEENKWFMFNIMYSRKQKIVCRIV